MRALPDLGGMIPVRVASSVVLPMPEGPTIARDDPGRSVSEIPVASVGPPGQPMARSRASMTVGPSGTSWGCAGASSSRSEQMRVAAWALRTSWAAAGVSSATPSKEDRGTRTMTARRTCVRTPEVVCGIPMRSAPMTATPIAHTSRPRANADKRAERARAALSAASDLLSKRRARSSVPAMDSSVAPSRIASEVAAMSVRASAPWLSARRTERAMRAGAMTPETTRPIARMMPAAGEMIVMTPTVPTPTIAATRAGRRVLTTTLPTSSTSAPARVMRSPRRSVESFVPGAAANSS